MTRKEALTTLLEKVDAGEFTDDWMEVARALTLHPDDRHIIARRAFEGSIDAAKSLHEAVLSGCSAVVDMAGDCDLYGHTGDGEWEWLGCSSCIGNPARAWLIAILKALIAECDE